MQVRRHLDNPRGKKAADVGIKLENQFAMEAKALRTGLKAFTGGGGNLGKVEIVDKGQDHYLKALGQAQQAHAGAWTSEGCMGSDSWGLCLYH
jgi:hypothetical protein